VIDRPPPHPSGSSRSPGLFDDPVRWFVRRPLPILVLAAVVLIGGGTYYSAFRIDVRPGEVAVLIHRTGKELPNDMELAPDESYRGVLAEVMTEGRDFRNPLNWEWEIHKQLEVPQGKLAVPVRLFGKAPPAGAIIAGPGEKGVQAEVLKPGRYPQYSNPYAYALARNPADGSPFWPAVEVPAGHKGVVTLLAAPLPADPNVYVVPSGYRGTQPSTDALDPGTYYLNPFTHKVSVVDCRSKRYEMGKSADPAKTADGGPASPGETRAGGLHSEMGFMSSDGFWVVLEGYIEFRVNPGKVAETYCIYKDYQYAGDDIQREIVETVILPNARSFCRITGAKSPGGAFISGETRRKFQDEFKRSLKETCERMGVDVLDALVTNIRPPEDIAEPIRQREVAKQRAGQYEREKERELSEAKLKIETRTIDKKRKLIQAQQEVVTTFTKAEQEQEVAKTQAEQRLKVAQTRLEAARDQASALMAAGRAKAAVKVLENKAYADGLAAGVEAFGDGNLYAQHVLLQKVAPSLRSLMGNTEGSIFTDMFAEVWRAGRPAPPAPPSATGPAKLADDARVNIPPPSPLPAAPAESPAPSPRPVPPPPLPGPVGPPAP
jgi:regulator of protease activity HflC (stomatin/prohibitin superfamily)